MDPTKESAPNHISCAKGTIYEQSADFSQLPKTSNPRNLQTTFEERPAGKFELICIFFCAMGVTIGFTATLSCVNYLTAIFDDKNIFLYLCCCVYLPTLPVVLFQMNCDQALDRRWGSTRTYYGRVTFAFISHICCTLYLPFGSGVNPEFEGERSYLALMIPVAIIGLETSVLQGMFFQLVSFIQFKKKGAGTAAFTFGYQGSGFFTLAITYACGGIGTDPTAMQIDEFFFIVAGLELVALLCFNLMAYKSVPYNQGIARRDEEMKWLAFKEKMAKKRSKTPSTLKRIMDAGKQLLSSPLLADYDQQYFDPQVQEIDRKQSSTSENPKTKSSLSVYYSGTEEGTRLLDNEDIEREVIQDLMGIVQNMESGSKIFVFKRIWPCFLGLFLVIFGSIFLMPFYTYIPGKSSLPQVLFFTKLFSDTLSRPLTMVIPKPSSKYCYLLMTFLRLAIFLPIFFLYIYDLLGIQNDYFIIGMVALFSMTSGLFGTFGYQLAPNLLKNQNSKLVSANQMNLSFNIACVMALVVSFTIIHTVDLD